MIMYSLVSFFKSPARVLVLLLGLCCFAEPATAQKKNRSGSRNRPGVVKGAPTLAGYQYRERVEGADPSASQLPLVIALPWMGSTPESFEKFVSGLNFPVRILIVQAPYPYKDGYSFYSLAPKNYYRLPEDEKLSVLLNEGEKLSRFIQAATERYAPKQKPVIIGASQGGDLSYVIAIKYPHLISQAYPLLATMDNRIVIAPGNRPSVPIHAYHGTADPIVPIAVAREHVQLLRSKGYTAQLHEYEGVRHDITDAMKADYLEQITQVLKL